MFVACHSQSPESLISFKYLQFCRSEDWEEWKCTWRKNNIFIIQSINILYSFIAGNRPLSLESRGLVNWYHNVAQQQILQEEFEGQYSRIQKPPAFVQKNRSKIKWYRNQQSRWRIKWYRNQQRKWLFNYCWKYSCCRRIFFFTLVNTALRQVDYS